MTYKTLVLKHILCFCLFICGSASNFYKFSKDSTLDNFVCPQTDKTFETFIGEQIYMIRCLLVCLQDRACMSVFYNSGTGFCVGCNAAYFGVETLTESHGFSYFARKTKDLGERCFTGDTCTGSNQVCWSDTCICEIGYSLQPSSTSCVDSCTTYGSTFQKYPHMRIGGYNLENVNNITLAECKDLCVGNTMTLCLSIEYDDEIMKCHTSEESALSVPADVKTSVALDFYTRNCED